ATSRKKLLDSITLDDIKPSSRRFPYVAFSPERDIGNDMLRVENLTKTINGQKVLDNVSFIINPNEKLAFVGKDDIAKTTLFEIINGERQPDSRTDHCGVTTSQSYFRKDSSAVLDDSDLKLVDWLRQLSPEDESETFLRSFLRLM